MIRVTPQTIKDNPKGKYIVTKAKNSVCMPDFLVFPVMYVPQENIFKVYVDRTWTTWSALTRYVHGDADYDLYFYRIDDLD